MDKPLKGSEQQDFYYGGRPLDEERLIEAVLTFANLRVWEWDDRRPWTARARIEDLFRAVPGVELAPPWIADNASEDYYAEQRAVRAWLTELAALRRGKRGAIPAQLREQLDEAWVVPVQGWTSTPWIQSVWECCVKGVMLLAERHIGRVAHCTAPGCDEFFLAPHSNGRPRRYCTTAHQLAAVAMRRAAVHRAPVSAAKAKRAK